MRYRHDFRPSSPSARATYIRDLTTGIFSEEVYGVGYGQNLTSMITYGYFFMFCQCKGNDPDWGYWNPSIGAGLGDPWIAGSPGFGFGPMDRFRTIVTGQEAQNGYCVSNQDPHIYMGSGLTSATLFSYLPLTPDLNLDQNVNIKDIAIAAKEFGIDPPEEQVAASTRQAPPGILLGALGASALIALSITVYKLERKRTRKG